MEKYHLTHDGENWKLKKEGAKRSSKVFDDSTKQEAVRQAAEFMREHPGSLKIHKQDGPIQEERTYPRRNDPPQSKG